MKDPVILTLFVAFLAAGVLEGVTAIVWWRWFYRSAPRLWRREVRADPTVFEGAVELAIAEATNSRFWRPIVFRRLSDTEVAFRESLLSFRPATGIAGLIREEPAKGVLTFTARCSWFIVLGLSLALGGTLDGNLGSVFVGVFLAALLAGQYRRLRTMSHAAQSQEP